MIGGDNDSAGSGFNFEDDSVGSPSRRSEIQKSGVFDPHENRNFTHVRGLTESNELHRQMVEDINNQNSAIPQKFDTRLGGNYMHVNDPNLPPYTPFYLMITGHIQSGTMDERDGICAVYSFNAGVDWQLHSVSKSVCVHFVQGNKEGVSQHAYKSQQMHQRVVWNYPFELTYRSFNIMGWPQMVFQFTSRDFLGRDVICGYGVIHVPT